MPIFISFCPRSEPGYWQWFFILVSFGPSSLGTQSYPIGSPRLKINRRGTLSLSIRTAHQLMFITRSFGRTVDKQNSAVRCIRMLINMESDFMRRPIDLVPMSVYSMRISGTYLFFWAEAGRWKESYHARGRSGSTGLVTTSNRYIKAKRRHTSFTVFYLFFLRVASVA